MKSYMQIFRPTAILISVCVVSLRAHPGPVCGKDLSVGAGVASSGLCLAAPDDLQGQARSSKLKIAVAQTVIENTLEKNLAKMVRMIDDAGARGCRLAIFPENALYWADVSTDGATKEDIDAAIEKIAERAGRADLCVVFGTSHKPSDGAKYRNRGYVFGSDGDMLVSCWKTKDVPNAFEACGVVCNLVICSDRTFLEYSDLPCLVQGSQIIIDISGGHATYPAATEATTEDPTCDGYATGRGLCERTPTSLSAIPCTTIPTSWATRPGEDAARLSGPTDRFRPGSCTRRTC